MKKILIGGSPCTHWSIAQQSERRETQAEGLGWELFKNYLIAKEKFNPDIFLYENNKSAARQIKESIHSLLGGEMIYINSGLVSGQNRQRFYVHNISGVKQPEDRKITASEVLENCGIAFGVNGEGKAHCIDANYWKGSNIKQTLTKHRRTMVAERVSNEGEKTYKVIKGEIVFNGESYKTDLPDGLYRIRNMYPIECERLQTLPDNYTAGVSNTERFKGIGNGWTAEIIKHILRAANIPKEEEILVLSLYDGIGTGRYCLDSLGYKNIKYYAYEIEPAPIKIALKNYPDIIECGDAFQVREENWKIEI